jgi:hypothetical protein
LPEAANQPLSLLHLVRKLKEKLNPSQPTFLVTIALAFGYLLFLSFLPSFLPFGLASRAEMSKATARYHGRIQLWIEVELRNKTVNKA